MANETFAIESTLSPADAYARLVDLSRVTEWDHGIRDCALASGTPGTVGARYELTVTGFDGEPTTAIYELTEVTPGEGFTMVGTNPEFRADDTVTVEPTADGCRVTYDAGLVLTGEQPPVTDEQLDRLFASIVEVPARGLQVFLNP